MLISGIINLVYGLILCSTCWGAIVGIPLIVFSIFELILVGQANKLPLKEFKEKAQGIGISEVCEFLCINIFSGICGIIVLINLKDIKQ